MDPTGPIARRFPLVARPRPTCTPLPQRVADLRARAAAAAGNQDTAAATAVFNLAALLASDCGLPDLARHWCHRLARITVHDHPRDARHAILSLEPIVNLARLRTRASDGNGAWSLLENLYHAVASRTGTIIDGVQIPTERLTSPPQAHRELRAWLWSVLLSDGGRALAAAGRWHEAHQRLTQYKGVGHRMLDGRQIAVIAHTTAGDHNQAQALLHTTQPGQPWEAAITACLTLLCQPHPTTSADPSDALAIYRGLDTAAAGLTLFRTRLGLSLMDALGTAKQPATQSIAANLLDQATTDGYAAREVLAHPSCRDTATNRQTHALVEFVAACALDSGHIPDPMLANISATLHTAEQVISHTPADAVIATVPP